MLLAAGTVASRLSSTHLLIISLMLSEDLLSHFFLAFMDIRIELVTILLDGELLVVINWNEDFLSAHWFLLGIMELLHIWMLQSLLSRESFIWIELEQVFQKIKGFFRCCREHISQLFWLGWW